MRFINEPVAAAISALEGYVDEHSSPERSVLADLRKFTYDKIKDPQYIAGHVQGNFLSMLSRMIQPKRVLEIGTFTGYSAVCFADGLVPGGQVVSIESNPDLWEIAESYWRKVGATSSIRLMKGNALDIIPTLEGGFDMVYIDGEKTEYSEYYELAMTALRPKGFIVADNALWYGRVLRKEMDEETQAIDVFNKLVHNDPRVFNVVVSIRDGVMLAQKL